ncbi:MAG: MarR family transcriptional regulator [Candidatus Dadabacteria bacterium]|nr:MarR family transcriptional regulator [Candidatus Dadabacteria bacterium]NIQ16618.1 MarR family transcriptional regulator [Candidatus Dadabacteria bacterium]
MKLKLSEKETNAWVGFIKSEQMLIKKIEDEFKKNKFPPLSWYDILLELDKSENGSLRLNDIGKKVLLNKYSITRLIERMEKDGLVSKETCPVDGRGKFACITDKGKKIRKKMWPVYYNVIKENFLSKFSKDELDEFSTCISKIIS